MARHATPEELGNLAAKRMRLLDDFVRAYHEHRKAVKWCNALFPKWSQERAFRKQAAEIRLNIATDRLVWDDTPDLREHHKEMAKLAQECDLERKKFKKKRTPSSGAQDR